MYKTEGVALVASITELRMNTSDVLEAVTSGGVVGVQRNNEPVAAMLSMDTYRALKAALAEKDMTLEDL